MDRIKCFMVEPVDIKTGEEGRRSCRCWRNPSTGEERDGPHQFGPGAMWYAFWLEDRIKLNPDWNGYGNLGPDGRVLMVETPDGTWCIDSRASNCDMKEDTKHRCWVRHGVPPEVHVDKNGLSCHAGAGSIQTSKWHGFLTNGYLQEQR